MGFAIALVNIITNLLTLLVIAEVVVSYFMSPYHPFRMTLDRFVEPMLKPIRRYIPPIQNIDLSPVVLIVLIQLISQLLIFMLSRIG
jgi:YggT family protein